MQTEVDRSKPRFQFGGLAQRMFGYDFFVSFKLGHFPTGTQSYASDLARALREEDYSVFYSEEEASPGEELAPTLVNALNRSAILVVILNKAADGGRGRSATLLAAEALPPDPVNAPALIVPNVRSALVSGPRGHGRLPW
jgi:hypothetical protein